MIKTKKTWKAIYGCLLSSTIFVVLAGIISFVFFTVKQSPTTNAQIWYLEDANTDLGEIKWQKSIPCIARGYAPNINIIGVSSKQVIVHRSCTGFDAKLIALDIETGAEVWSVDFPPVIQIIYSDGGYVVLHSDRYISKIDNSGAVVWQSQKFGSRSIFNIFEFEDEIYAPFKESTTEGIYIISSQTGETLDILQKGDIWVVGNIKLQYSAGNLYLKDHGDTIWKDELFRVNYRSNLNNVSFIDNKVYVLDNEKLNTYNADTGNFLRSLDLDTTSHPYFINDKTIVFKSGNVLTVYDKNGEVIGSSTLSRTSSPDNLITHQVSLNGFGDNIVILFLDLNELLMLSLNS